MEDVQSLLRKRVRQIIRNNQSPHVVKIWTLTFQIVLEVEHFVQTVNPLVNPNALASYLEHFVVLGLAFVQDLLNLNRPGSLIGG